MSLWNASRTIYGWIGIEAFFSSQPQNTDFSKQEAADRDVSEIVRYSQEAFSTSPPQNPNFSKQQAAKSDASEIAIRSQEAFRRWATTQKPEKNTELPPFIIVHIMRHGSIRIFLPVNGPCPEV